MKWLENLVFRTLFKGFENLDWFMNFIALKCPSGPKTKYHFIKSKKIN